MGKTPHRWQQIAAARAAHENIIVSAETGEPYPCRASSAKPIWEGFPKMGDPKTVPLK